MRMIAPRIEGLDEITIAEDQEEYKPVVGALFRYPADDPDFPSAVSIITRWRFTPDDRARIAAGEDLFLGHLTFGGPLQPIAVQVGPDGWGELEPSRESARP